MNFKEKLQLRLPELLELESLRAICEDFGKVRIESEVFVDGIPLPILSIVLGSEDMSLPCVAIIGGVHGLERIGSAVAIAFLKIVLEMIQWDRSMIFNLANCRLLFVPILNPGGMYQKTRCNPAGVDLMRNAPLDAKISPPLNLVCGHRFGPSLPWFRGYAGGPMETEAITLLNIVRRELFPSRFSVALDLHSGFGFIDRLWFPYASNFEPIPDLDLAFALKNWIDQTLPTHSYLVEPQSKRYLTHGDLWDYLYLEHGKKYHSAKFFPMTLEMGSWLWIKKNPKQLFSGLGIFNPIVPHRIQRTLRRHLSLLDFFVRAAVSHKRWAGQRQLKRGDCRKKAMDLWYPDANPW